MSKKLISLTILIITFTALTLCGCGSHSYIAAAGPSAMAFSLDDSGQLTEADPLARGTEVKVTGDKIDSYVSVEADGETFYVDEAAITDSLDGIILEDKAYVRTPVTIYKSRNKADIEAFAPKGEELEILEHSKVRADGSIKKYKVKCQTGQGWVYGKYLAFDEDSAMKKCNDKGAYDMAKDAGYRIELYGGDATDLDFYPCPKASLKGNEFLADARAMYLHAGAIYDDRYFELAKKSGANAVVINIDGGTLAYKSPVAEKMCPTAYKKAHHSMEKYQAAVKKYQDAGFYTIGRIVAFNDPNYAKDHKEACIISGGKNTQWVSAYNRGAWEYKVALAREAVQEMGFNEIQFDYVRFPERAYDMSAGGNTDFRNKYGETKSQAIQNFCFYATDQIHEAGAYVSIDVFGECSNGYVTAYGQYWPAISNVVDAISSMPYTDHFGETDTWSNPYNVMYGWAKRSAGYQKHIPTPACARTWITGYNTPHWNPTVNYDYEKLHDQVKALEDAGLDGGFIPWNSSCDFSKYKQYSKIWNK